MKLNFCCYLRPCHLPQLLNNIIRLRLTQRHRAVVICTRENSVTAVGDLRTASDVGGRARDRLAELQWKSGGVEDF